MTKQGMRSLANFILFQIAWFAAVLVPGTVSITIGLIALALHFTFISTFRLRELRFVIMAGVLGIVADVLLQNLGVLRFPGYDGYYAEGMIPAWLAVLWLVFATAVNHCLYWIRNHPVVLFGLPPFAGALAYGAAERFGAIELGYGLWGLFAMAVAWGILYPIFVRISQWLEETEEEPLVEQRW